MAWCCGLTEPATLVLNSIVTNLARQDLHFIVILVVRIFKCISVPMTRCLHVNIHAQFCVDKKFYHGFQSTLVLIPICVPSRVYISSILHRHFQAGRGLGVSQ